MRVLIVTQYFHPEPFRVNDLAVALHTRGHAVAVLTGMPNYPAGHLYPGYGAIFPGSEDYCGVSVIRAPLITRGSSKGWRLILNFISFALSASISGFIRCRGKFDIILVYQPSPITVALPAFLLRKIKGAPVMLWIQDLWPDTLAAVGQHGRLSHVAAAIANWVHQRCDLLLVQSDAFTKPLIARGIPAKSIRYLPNWAEDFYKQPAEASMVDPLAKFRGTRILFAGNIGSAQSFETIIEAARLIKHRVDIHWIIVGDGLMHAEVKNLIETHDLADTVEMLGRFPPEYMPLLFSHADALLVTLRANPVFAMTIPSKIQSYLASGVALVGALDGEGARVIREAGAGLVADAEDAPGLAQCVLQLAAMAPAERTKMGLRGRDYLDRHFNRDRLLDQLEVWMQNLKKATHADTGTWG